MMPRPTRNRTPAPPTTDDLLSSSGVRVACRDREDVRQPAEEDEPMPSATVDDDEVIAALRSGDQAAFAAVTEQFRRQLHVHCYRMLGSFDDAEEIVQETFLRAWRARQRSRDGRCCGAGSTASRQTPASTSSRAAVRNGWSLGDELPWLQPYPDAAARTGRAQPRTSRRRWPSAGRRSSSPSSSPSSTSRRGSARC